ncbi:hypothetical protein HYT52_04240 [Candidatus Woesearchaeota archaeon]|nr:hypothetical protein [Candidatus Woesearchaeota archaeon]
MTAKKTEDQRKGPKDLKDMAKQALDAIATMNELAISFGIIVGRAKNRVEGVDRKTIQNILTGNDGLGGKLRTLAGLTIRRKLMKFKQEKEKLFKVMAWLIAVVNMRKLVSSPAFKKLPRDVQARGREVSSLWGTNQENINTYCNSILVLLTNSNESELFQFLETDESFSKNKAKMKKTLTTLEGRITSLESVLGGFVSNLRTIQRDA